MTSKTIIPELSNERKNRIQKIMKHHYGFEPENEEIERIDGILRSINTQSTLHDEKIIRYFVIEKIHKILSKHRERIGNTKYETLLLDKLIFLFLTWAQGCYKDGFSIASISLCRIALESGLKEKLAEVWAKEEGEDVPKRSRRKWMHLKKLQDLMLKDLIQKAKDEGIITNEFERTFKNLKFKKKDSRKILDKFIHGDIVWIADFIRAKDENTRIVIGAEDIIDENKIVMLSGINNIAIQVLIGTTEIAEKLYFKNI